VPVKQNENTQCSENPVFVDFLKDISATGSISFLQQLETDNE